VALVPTGINAGVSTTPFGVVNVPVRANEFSADFSISNLKPGLAVVDMSGIVAELTDADSPVNQQ
jgi:hypothetical protein